jgi:hypothetical protein
MLKLILGVLWIKFKVQTLFKVVKYLTKEVRYYGNRLYLMAPYHIVLGITLCD